MNSMKRMVQIINKIIYHGYFIAFLKVGRTYQRVYATNLYGRFNVLVIKGGTVSS